jgi:ParB family chromosome partitioning protein
MAALLSNAAPPPSVGPLASAAISGRSLLALPIEVVERNPGQPRRQFDEQKLAELAASIREHGVIEPILVRRDGRGYRLVAGERRWRAAQRAGLKEIPAIIREASEREAFELALVENLQRTDLNAIEEAEAYQILLTDHSLTQDEVASRVGKERSTVANALRLLRLPEAVREAVAEGRLDMGHARALLSLPGAEEIGAVAARVIREGLSVRATEALVRGLTTRTATKPSRGVKGGNTPAIRDLTQRLQRRLGARCKVIQRSAVAGRLEIEYSSLDELDGILAKIGA